MEPLEKARAAARAARERGEVRTITHNWIVKAKAKPQSLKTAINAKCFECMGGTEDELPDAGWKREIANCSAPNCPLYSHRPYQSSTPDNEDVEESDVESTIDTEDVG